MGWKLNLYVLCHFLAELTLEKRHFYLVINSVLKWPKSISVSVLNPKSVFGFRPKVGWLVCLMLFSSKYFLLVTLPEFLGGWKLNLYVLCHFLSEFTLEKSNFYVVLNSVLKWPRSVLVLVHRTCSRPREVP